MREKGTNAYVISTGTIENPQYHVIAYDKSKAVEAKSLNDLRVKENAGACFDNRRGSYNGWIAWARPIG